jgi:hypothetical protein
MKIRNQHLCIAATALALTTAAQAAVSVTNTYLTLDGVVKDGYTNPLAVDTGGPNPTTVNDGTLGTRRFGYLSKITYTTSTTGSWNTTISAGGWSYADIRDDHYFTGNNGNTGWGHASRWFLVELQEATLFNISMLGAGDALPGFVIFGGESLNHTWGEAHRYSNNGVEMFRNDGWDKNTTPLGYVAHGFNASGNSLSETIALDAGLYTIALGNIGSSTMTTGAKSFDIIMAVPEPSTALLGALGVFALLRRRRA